MKNQNQTKPKHTPDWACIYEDRDCRIVGPERDADNAIADVYGGNLDEQRQAGELIVHAVNSHAALAEALEEAVLKLDAKGQDTLIELGLDAWIFDARAALAAAGR